MYKFLGLGRCASWFRLYFSCEMTFLKQDWDSKESWWGIVKMNNPLLRTVLIGLLLMMVIAPFAGLAPVMLILLGFGVCWWLWSLVQAFFTPDKMRGEGEPVACGETAPTVTLRRGLLSRWGVPPPTRSGVENVHKDCLSVYSPSAPLSSSAPCALPPDSWLFNLVHMYYNKKVWTSLQPKCWIWLRGEFIEDGFKLLPYDQALYS